MRSVSSVFSFRVHSLLSVGRRQLDSAPSSATEDFCSRMRVEHIEKRCQVSVRVRGWALRKLQTADDVAEDVDGANKWTIRLKDSQLEYCRFDSP